MSFKGKKQQDKNLNETIEQTAEKYSLNMNQSMPLSLALQNKPSQYSSVVERLGQKYLQKDHLETQNQNSQEKQFSMTPNLKKFYNSVDEKQSKKDYSADTIRKNKLIGKSDLSRNSKSFNKSMRNALSSSQNKKGSFLQKNTEDLLQEISVFSLQELQIAQKADEQEWAQNHINNNDQVIVIQPIKDKDQQLNIKNELQNLQKLINQEHKFNSYISKSQTSNSYQFDEVLHQNYEYLQRKCKKEKSFSHSNDQSYSFKNIHFNSQIFQKQFNQSMHSINQDNLQNFFYAHLNTLPIDNASNYLEQKTFQNYGNFLQIEDQQKIKENIIYKSLKKLLKFNKKQINEQKQQIRQDSKLTGFFNIQNTDRISKNDQSQITINISILMLYKNEIYDLLNQEEQPTNQFNFTFKNQNNKRKQMVFQNCFYKYDFPQYETQNQYQEQDNNMSQIIQFKKLTGNQYMSICNKNDIRKILKIARNNKQELSLKLKLDLNQLTKLSGIYVKVQVCKKSVVLDEKENQFVFLEMPVTNIFNNQNKFDSVKQFVSESHKSLQQICKLLQLVKNNNFCKIKNNIKNQQYLQQSLLALLLQDSLLFSNPCEAVLNLSVPSDLKNWHIANLSLNYLSQIREKTNKIANILQNYDILVQTLNTIDEELNQIDAQVMIKIQNTMDQEQQYKNAVYQENPQMLIYQNDQDQNEFYQNIIQEDLVNQEYNQDNIQLQDQDAVTSFRQLIQIYKDKLQELRNKNEGDVKIDIQIEINNELQKIKFRIEQIQNQLGIERYNDIQNQTFHHTKILDNTFHSTPQQQVAQLSQNYHQFLQNQQTKQMNRVSFSPSNQSSKQVTSKKLGNSSSQHRIRKDLKTPKIQLNENLEDYKYSSQLISLSEQKQSKALRTISSKKDDQQKSNYQSRKQTDGKITNITSPNTPQNIKNSRSKKMRNSLSRKPRTTNLSQNSRMQTSLSPQFIKQNDNKNKKMMDKNNLNNSSTAKSLKYLAQKESTLKKYPSINHKSKDYDNIIDSGNSYKFQKNQESLQNDFQVNSENYKNQKFQDLKTQQRLNQLISNQTVKQEQSKVQMKNSLKKKEVQSRNENRVETQKKVDFSFQKLEQLNPRNDQQTGFRKILSEQNSNNLNYDNYNIVTQRIENHNSTLFCANEKHVATQDSQFYGNVVGDTIQPYNNPLQSQLKINQSLEANQFTNQNPLGSFQKKSQALLEQYRQKKSSILKNQNLIKHSKKSSQKLQSGDSQKGSKLKKRESSLKSQKDNEMGRDLKIVQNTQLNQDIMLQKMEIKHLKENLEIAQQLQIGMEKALKEEIKQVGQMVKEGDEKVIFNKIQQLLEQKVKSKIKRNKLIIKLMEERRQRKRVQAQRDLMISKRSNKNSCKKNASSKKSKKQSRSNKSKSILSNKSNFMNGSSKFTDFKNYSISQKKDISKSRNVDKLKKNKTQKEGETSQMFSQPSSCNRGKSQISFNLNRTAGEIEERKKSQKKLDSDSNLKKKSRSLSSTKKLKKSRSIQKTIDKQNEVIDLLEKENVKLQKEYVKQIQHSQNVQQNLEQQLIEIKEHLLTQESQRVRLQSEIDNLKIQNQSLKDTNQAQEEKIKSMKTEKDYIKEIQELNIQKVKLIDEKEEMKIECDRLINIEQAKDSYRKECLQLREENKELNRQVLAYQKSIKAKNTDWNKNEKFQTYLPNEKSEKKQKYQKADCANSDKENIF